MKKKTVKKTVKSAKKTAKKSTVKKTKVKKVAKILPLPRVSKEKVKTLPTVATMENGAVVMVMPDDTEAKSNNNQKTVQFENKDGVILPVLPSDNK